jgi:hypothetical protein
VRSACALRLSVIFNNNQKGYPFFDFLLLPLLEASVLPVSNDLTWAGSAACIAEDTLPLPLLPVNGADFV